MNKPTKNAQLIFEQEVLLQDIKDLAWVEGETMDEANPNRHLLQDICEDGNIDRVNRTLSNALADIVELLYPLTKDRLGNSTARSNYVKETSSYVITMNIPEDYSTTSLDVIKNNIHEYLVCRVMVDFTSRLNPDTVEVWSAKAEGAKENVSSTINMRMRRVRRFVSPI